MKPKFSALALPARIAATVIFAGLTSLTGSSPPISKPPHAKTGENLTTDMITKDYPAVYVRGNKIVVIAPSYSYRSVYIVLNPNNSLPSMGIADQDSTIAPEYTGYVSVVRDLKKGARATIPITKFVDNKGHPFPPSTHISEIGVIFNGGANGGMGGFGPTYSD